MPNYQIRRLDDPSRYSNGIVTCVHVQEKIYRVSWQAKGKVWKSEKAVKNHLLKYITLVGSISNLEIVEVVLVPTMPAHDWIDAKMLMKVLKNK